MTLYHTHQPDAPIRTLECVRTDGRRSREALTYFTLSDPARRDEAVALLRRALPHQTHVGTTEVAGKAVIITRGREAPADLLRQLNGAGQDFIKQAPEKKFDAWKWRGNLSNFGQGFQLLSAALKKEKGFDHSVLGFAVFNLAANMMNLVFGGERKPDINRLHHLKSEFNAQITPYLASDAPLPDPGETLTKGRQQKKSEALGSSIYGFLKRNSVVFGEIGLRYIGAFNLAFPIAQWVGKGRQAFAAAEGPMGTRLKAGFSAAGKNFHNKESLVFYSGIAYLVGKTIALGSKVPDPYDSKPHGVIDSFRERGMFKLSTVIETIAAATLTVNGLKPGKVSASNPDGARLHTRNRTYWLPDAMKHEKFITRDWFGAAGGALFTAGLAIRFTAPFGTREVNLKELNAHIAAGLAQVPAQKRPQLLADSALAVTAQFPDQHLEFGSVYTALVTELERYHHIAILKPEPSLRLATRVEPGNDEPHSAHATPRPHNTIDARTTHAADIVRMQAPDSLTLSR